MRHLLIISALLLSGVSSAASVNVDPALVAAAQSDIKTAPSWVVIDNDIVSAASKGDAVAQATVGSFYNNTRREDIAVTWFQMAADQGNAKAQLQLAMAYDRGLGVSIDKLESIKYYKLAVAQGYDFAQFMLASKYTEGLDVEQDFVQAAKLYQLAIDQGFDLATERLGKIYAIGQGVPKDVDRAIKLYQRSAQDDSGEAQFALATLYDEKHSSGDVSVDYLLKAYAWLRLAASSEVEEKDKSAMKLAEVTARMTPEQLSAGKALVAHCFPNRENKVYQYGCTQDQPF